MSRAADQVWNSLVSLVWETRHEWRRRVAEATGLPFGRVRALRRLQNGPLALHELAEAMSSDAPAATVAVNDLEKRGLVMREAHPTNRRVKQVSLTPAGRRMVARVDALTEEAPPALAALPSGELAVLARMVGKLTR